MKTFFKFQLDRNLPVYLKESTSSFMKTVETKNRKTLTRRKPKLNLNNRPQIEKVKNNLRHADNTFY